MLYRRTRAATVVAALILSVALQSTAIGQSGLKPSDASRSISSAGRSTPPAGEGEISLPSDSRQWHNSPPLSLESLSGKGVVLYFFDEECPRCADGWPKLQSFAKQYDGKPIVFIAVNSGTEPRELKRYLSHHKVALPVINDYDRSLEYMMGVPKLTVAGEVAAVKYVTAEGVLASGKLTDFAGTAEAALKGAAWRVEPSVVPPQLRSAWMSIELGDFASAARAVTKASDSKDEALKNGATALLDAVKIEATAEARTAKEALDEGNTWTGYKRLKTLGSRYKGYELPLLEGAAAKAKELAKSESIKDEITAAKLLNKAIATGSKGTSGAINRAKGLLKRITDDYSDSEAATRAQEFLSATDR